MRLQIDIIKARSNVHLTKDKEHLLTFVDDKIELVTMMERRFEKKYNFKITNHVIQFYGLCEK